MAAAGVQVTELTKCGATAAVTERSVEAVGAAVPLRASQRAISSPATLPGSTMQRYCRNSVW